MIINSALRGFGYCAAGMVAPEVEPEFQFQPTEFYVTARSRTLGHPTARFTDEWSMIVSALGHQDALRLAKIEATCDGLEIGQIEVRKI